MAKVDVTDLLKRDPAQEEEAGIRLAGLLAMLDESGYSGEPYLEMLGEVLTGQGARFLADARIQFVALNDRDQVVGVLCRSVSQGEAGYEAFDEGTRLQAMPHRIKVVCSR